VPEMPRVQDVVLPLLRAVPAFSGFKVGSWVEDIDYRDFPLINVRRVGGPRHATKPKKLALPVIELTVYGTVDLPTTEDMYEDALEALYDAVLNQTLTDAGYLHSIKETMGATQFQSPFSDNSWRVQGLIQLGVRPRSA
jgi:hypothetical protein